MPRLEITSGYALDSNSTHSNTVLTLVHSAITSRLNIAECTAGKIHISEATKEALERYCDVDFEVELRGEIDVKVRQVSTGKL